MCLPVMSWAARPGQVIPRRPTAHNHRSHMRHRAKRRRLSLPIPGMCESPSRNLTSSTMHYTTTMCLCSLSPIPLPVTLPSILFGNRMSIGDGSNGWRNISISQQHRRISEQGEPRVSLNCRFVEFWRDENENSHSEEWLCVMCVVSDARCLLLLPPAVAQEAGEAGREEEPGGGWSPR